MSTNYSRRCLQSLDQSISPHAVWMRRRSVDNTTGCSWVNSACKADKCSHRQTQTILYAGFTELDYFAATGLASNRDEPFSDEESDDASSSDSKGLDDSASLPPNDKRPRRHIQDRLGSVKRWSAAKDFILFLSPRRVEDVANLLLQVGGKAIVSMATPTECLGDTHSFLHTLYNVRVYGRIMYQALNRLSCSFTSSFFCRDYAHCLRCLPQGPGLSSASAFLKYLARRLVYAIFFREFKGTPRKTFKTFCLPHRKGRTALVRNLLTEL